jgi:hypothetical protein
MDFLNNYLIYLIPVFGLIGILVMAVKAAWVTKQETGDGEMAHLPATLPMALWPFYVPNGKYLAVLLPLQVYYWPGRYYGSYIKPGYCHIICYRRFPYRPLPVIWACVLLPKQTYVLHKLPVPVWLKH